MKKALWLGIGLTVMLCLAGCGNKAQETQAPNTQPPIAQEKEKALSYKEMGFAVDTLSRNTLLIRVTGENGVYPEVRGQCLFKKGGEIIQEQSTSCEMVGEVIMTFAAPKEYDTYEIKLTEGEELFHKDVKENVAASAKKDAKGYILLTLDGKADDYQVMVMCYAGDELVGISEYNNCALNGELITTISSPGVEFDSCEAIVNCAVDY